MALEFDFVQDLDLDAEREVLEGRPSGAVPIKRIGGRDVYDVMLVGVFLHLVSPAVIAVLEALDAKGWTAMPVTSDVERVQDYRLLGVTGRCGLEDANRRQRAMSAAGAGSVSVPVRLGMFFKNDEWDGSDVFTMPNGGFTIVTERVVDALYAAKITNLGATRLTEFEQLGSP